jgi:hypothetical protein
MSVHFLGAAFPRRRLAPLPGCGWQVWLLCFAFVFGRACGLPPPFFGPEPSNPNVRVPPVSYRSVIAPYVSLRPVKPGNWQQQNQSVAPQGETSAHHH